MRTHWARILFSTLLGLAHAGSVTKVGSVCTVHPGGVGKDDAPAIVAAFQQCSHDATVFFQNETYHIESVMSTTGLRNVTVDLQGTLLWGTNITYWRNQSLPLGYQNQTTAWQFGGSNVTWIGHGYGTFNGNGQLWYDFAKSASNVAGRPIALVITNTTDSVFDGIRFVQSQFWTMAITYSKRLLLENIYINSTSSNGNSTLNTDGVDTFWSDSITFRNWSVDCGDDNISPKANSTNILIQDSVFHRGNGVAIGSIGQYPNLYEFIENVTAERIVLGPRAQHIAYVKTWTGVQKGYPPNGGGGGIGYAKNMVFRNFTLQNIAGIPATVTQCTNFEGIGGDCDTSRFQLSNLTWGPVSGTTSGGVLAELQCSAAAPCPGIQFVGWDQIKTSGTRNITCSNIQNPVGFNCTQGS